MRTSPQELRIAAFNIESRKAEMTRLQGILRNPSASPEEKRIAGDMLAHHERERHFAELEAKPIHSLL
jgi:hypothetical protein